MVMASVGGWEYRRTCFIPVAAVGGVLCVLPVCFPSIRSSGGHHPFPPPYHHIFLGTYAKLFVLWIHFFHVVTNCFPMTAVYLPVQRFDEWQHGASCQVALTLM